MLGNVHKGHPIFGMNSWSGKKGQNGTRQVGWLIKKGCPIFQPIMEETNLSNVPPLKVFSTKLWVQFILFDFNIHRVPWWNARKRIALRPRRNMVNWKRPSFSLVYMRKFDLLLLKTVYCTYFLYNLVLFLLYRVNRMLKMGAR